MIESPNRTHTIGWSDRWFDRHYFQRPGWINGTVQFHRVCAGHIPAGQPILEVGPGPATSTTEFLASMGPTHGIDIDPEAGANPFLQSFHWLRGPSYPFADASFAAAVSDYVVEHLADPREHLREVFRVLRPGGAYVLRTPNLYHYVAIVSARTPHWFHARVANRLRGLPVTTHMPYPTFYRMNTRRVVHDLATAAGFRVKLLEMVEKEPSYTRTSRAFFLAAMAYERAVNRYDVLESCRANIFAVLAKPSLSTPANA